MTFRTLILPFFILFLVPLSLTASAKGNQYSFFLNLGGDYQLNQGDIINNTSYKDVLTIKNTTGSRIGLEYRWDVPGRIFLQAGLDYRMIPQRLHVDYQSGKLGFANTHTVYSRDISFTNHNIDPSIRIGYAIPAGNNHIDFAFGTIICIPVATAGNGGELVSLHINDDDYTDPAMYINSAWGNKELDTKGGIFIPVKGLYSMQLAYRITPKKTTGVKFKIGIDFSGALSGRINRTEINYFGAGRNDAGNSIFADRFQSLGLLVGVGF